MRMKQYGFWTRNNVKILKQNCIFHFYAIDYYICMKIKLILKWRLLTVQHILLNLSVCRDWRLCNPYPEFANAADVRTWNTRLLQRNINLLIEYVWSKFFTDIWALYETVLNAVIVKYNGCKEIWVVFEYLCAWEDQLVNWEFLCLSYEYDWYISYLCVQMLIDVLCKRNSFPTDNNTKFYFIRWKQFCS